MNSRCLTMYKCLFGDAILLYVLLKKMKEKFHCKVMWFDNGYKRTTKTSKKYDDATGLKWNFENNLRSFIIFKIQFKKHIPSTLCSYRYILFCIK